MSKSTGQDSLFLATPKSRIAVLGGSAVWRARIEQRLGQEKALMVQEKAMIEQERQEVKRQAELVATEMELQRQAKAQLMLEREELVSTKEKVAL